MLFVDYNFSYTERNKIIVKFTLKKPDLQNYKTRYNFYNIIIECGETKR